MKARVNSRADSLRKRIICASFLAGVKHNSVSAGMEVGESHKAMQVRVLCSHAGQTLLARDSGVRPSCVAVRSLLPGP
jgi:hypothetical protein